MESIDAKAIFVALILEGDRHRSERYVFEVFERYGPASVPLSDRVPVVMATIDAVRHTVPSAKILVGGLATTSPAIAGTLGADAVAVSAAHAVEVARGWK